MTDPGPLLVPVAVDAWVLSRQTIIAYGPTKDSIRASMDYTELAQLGDPSPAPFHSDQTDFLDDTDNHGAYVMWTLPAGLRHGVQQSDGSIAFPHVPNRWLVIRLLRPASAPATATPEMTTWMVQSDALGQSDGVPYLDPHAATSKATQIGHRVAISDASPWQEPTPAGPYFLQAVAEGNVEFAAYQTFNQNVFSIHDDLLEQAVPPGTLSYQVVGWYSDPTADVLAGWQAGVAGNDWPDVMARLGWTPPDDQTTRSSMYHGIAPGVPWDPDGSANPPAEPAMQVAIGNTSVDAVVAFAEAALTKDPVSGLTPQQAADLLEAFQYNLLPMLGQAGAELAIEDRVRANWFGSAGGGTTWKIVDTEAPPGSPPLPPQDPSVIAKELAQEATWLPALNADQATLDANARALVAARRRLLELYWKSQVAPLIQSELGTLPWGISSLDQLTSAVTAEAQVVHGLMDAMTSALAQGEVPAPLPGQTLDDAIAAFAKAKGLPGWRTLKAVAQPPFFAPADPVMVVSGTGSGMTIDADATLACRWPAEIVTALTVTTGGGPVFEVTSAELAPRLPASAWTNLPATVPALYGELNVLDPANAALAAAAAGQTLTDQQLEAAAASIATPTPAANSGTAPGLAPLWPWTQPWRPVYLQWSVEWLPIPFQQANGTPNWTFDGLDYGTVASPVAGPATELSGRALVTPKPSFEFKSRLEQFTHDNPTSPATVQLGEIDQVIETVDAWDFLSQAFSGLTTQIALWDPIPIENPNAVTPLAGSTLTLTDLLGDALASPPQNLLAGSTDPRHHNPPTTSTFEGMRGGQLYFNRLAVVDAFGQTLDVVTQQSSQTFSPLRADGVTPQHPVVPTDPERVVQLPPRLVQPARLDLSFVAGASGNPILGWIVPNHLDEGLSVYGTDGTAYGELGPATDPSGVPFVNWSPAYGAPYATVAALAGAQPDLGGFLAGLVAAGTDALSAFVEALDETLWTVDPLGARSDAFLSVLLGRPLAVVAASVAFELQSDAYRDPSWPFTFSAPAQQPHFVGYEFPVRLGDLGFRQDGLLGYFADGDYAHFNAVHVPTANAYLRLVAPGNYVNLQFGATGAGPARTLTMLMDPRAGVHAACGILPTTAATLDPAWVDGSLKAMNVAFRTGPVVAPEQVDPSGTTRLILPSPAERHGTWSWSEAQLAGPATSLPLGPANPAAAFADQPPTLREGFLNLSGGLGE